MTNSRTKPDARAIGAVLALIGLALIPQFARAWGDLGHQTVAAIAEKNMKKETKDALRKILGPGPLAIQAIWPDGVRYDDEMGPFEKLHFIELPAGKRYMDPDLVAKRKATPKPDANTVLELFPDVIRSTDPSVTNEAKAVAIRYLLHVLGDIVMPLHVGTGMDTGGNDCLVLVDTLVVDDEASMSFALTRFLDLGPGISPPQKTYKKELMKLHTLWDEGIINHHKALERLKLVQAGSSPPKRYFEYAKDPGRTEGLSDQVIAHMEAEGMTKESVQPSFQPSDLAIWYDDAASVRDSGVYPRFKDLRDDPANPRTCVKDPGERERPRKLPPLGPDQVVPVDVDYLEKQFKVVERQLMKGGLRAAAYLDWVFAAGRTDPISLPIVPTVVAQSNSPGQHSLSEGVAPPPPAADAGEDLMGMLNKIGVLK